MQPIEDFYGYLNAPANIVITMHQKPDADAMGSALGLLHFLKQFGHTLTVISPTNWARWLNWMEGVDDVVDYELNKDLGDGIIDSATIIFCLDFNHLSRTKTLASKLGAANAIRVLIDHHQEPHLPSFAYGISNTAKSSTCEMIYDFIVGSGNGTKITKTIAECLYAGVVADTGSFRFSSTNASVHHMVAHLKELGLQHVQVHESLYDNYLENRLRFLGFILSSRMDVFYEYNAALIYVSKPDLLKYEIRTGDTEGIVNYPLSIQGIKLAACVIDRDEERKWSFRSKGSFDCNTFARQHFNGGGHFNAAGGHDASSLQDTIKKFRAALEKNSSLLK